MTSFASFAIAEPAEPSVGIPSSQRPTNKARSIASLLDIRNSRGEGRKQEHSEQSRNKENKEGMPVVR